jgi:hypothetical protein
MLPLRQDKETVELFLLPPSSSTAQDPRSVRCVQEEELTAAEEQQRNTLPKVCLEFRSGEALVDLESLVDAMFCGLSSAFSSRPAAAAAAAAKAPANVRRSVMECAKKLNAQLGDQSCYAHHGLRRVLPFDWKFLVRLDRALALFLLMNQQTGEVSLSGLLMPERLEAPLSLRAAAKQFFEGAFWTKICRFPEERRERQEAQRVHDILQSLGCVLPYSESWDQYCKYKSDLRAAHALASSSSSAVRPFCYDAELLKTHVDPETGAYSMTLQINLCYFPPGSAAHSSVSKNNNSNNSNNSNNKSEDKDGETENPKKKPRLSDL